MSHTGLKAAGKAVLVVAGVAFGFHRGVAGGRTGVEVPEGVGNGALPVADALPPPPTEVLGDGGGYVTREQLETALEQANRRFEAELDRRFEVQNHSISALHALVSQTDRMLERVLLHLEDAARISETDDSQSDAELPFVARSS